ncbi:unnamed protein product [Penicillium salamii]|uniref:Aminoglycoside phosphotransferase domain-containing protein n=1 Tax=Penicillium salamii TaxID=1612424 RepID=A0A9W4NPD3_9EURO|nr:unnamed protein product [Penicillium salamii]CAG8317776.1 unnamed protein product [Penicillium salamii]CAG8361893.1 unnamed protein product [Penicillium salamii]CAG8404143.1 unnamed protein product [Penicillium salamii]
MSIATITPKTGEVSQHGLEWVEETFGLEPRWAVEPQIEHIKQTVQSFRPSSTIEVTFLAQGAFNKLYDVKIDDETFIIRISLPVDPSHKVASEVATIDWIRLTTSLPVPRVITYQSSPDNLIEFEWILMTKVPGKLLADVWKSLSIHFDVKARLVKELAANMACLFRNQLQGIGNIHRKSSALEQSQSAEQTSPTESLDPAKTARLAESASSLDPVSNDSSGSSYDVGRIVSMQFFWGSHIHQNVFRGPFQSSQDWLLARLALNENDCQSILERNSAKDTEDLDSDDENEVEDARSALKRIERLKSILPLFFPTTSDSGFSEPSVMEPSVLSHDDLSRHNILVDESGNLTAVIDWECVSALPLWKSCDYPQFLKGRPRRSEPDRSRYYSGGPDDHTNGDPPRLYLEDLWEYQATLLRDVFIEEMKLLDAEWVTVFNESVGKRDFEFVVHNCDDEWKTGHIDSWLDDIAHGGLEGLLGLQDRIEQEQLRLLNLWERRVSLDWLSEIPRQFFDESKTLEPPNLSLFRQKPCCCC